MTIYLHVVRSLSSMSNTFQPENFNMQQSAIEGEVRYTVFRKKHPLLFFCVTDLSENAIYYIGIV